MFHKCKQENLSLFTKINSFQINDFNVIILLTVFVCVSLLFHIPFTYLGRPRASLSGHQSPV